MDSSIAVRARVYDNLSLVSQAVASPIRLRILQTLANSPSTVESISAKTLESVANTSQHLQKMLRAGILRCEKQGVSRVYSLANEQVLEMWLTLQKLAFTLNPQIQQDEELLCPQELCTDMNLSAIWKMVKAGKATFLDVRDLDDAQGTPLKEALHIPSAQIKKHLSAIPKSKTIFVFCRGRYCSLANPVVETLRKHGYKAYRLREMSYEIEKLY
ncbi:helix-turn-helix domain-containing protein [Bdellovibrio sp. 22V]|uniref:ArsR/SmtB family transcription factor n=1 Tax=Bdellovibrio TaxID=958 RepID=UPI002543F238|nr:helix-turn-helix domain-containing protein [Bdellovibrio sp. 22V]WII73926.1 helix-turn-helix domain-containing protein [Bdellovibrio sp. 22V]